MMGKTLDYRRLEGMGLQYIDGELAQESARILAYEVRFELSLDFTHFVHMSSQFIPNYLNDPLNAIRPELGGLAYHYSYNYFFNNAGNIANSEDLFEVFARPDYYMSAWSTGGVERCYGIPTFQIEQNKLLIKTSQRFRHQNEAPIHVQDLPLITFDWALNILEGHEFSFPPRAPASVMTLGYADEDFVDVGGVRVRGGTRYMIGSKLKIGKISPDQIFTAK